MDSHINVPCPTQQNDLKHESTANFQKFIFELFEKNGVINDLRAYLRGHIINVLRSSQIGELPATQKHFTQRLHLFYQGINMLIAEYLLRLDFSYSLSVFVTEIPLANMLFDFAKKLVLNCNGDFEKLKFKDNDIWSILNCLGVKCDSKYVTQITQMYNMGQDPLLLVILKTASVGQWDPIDIDSASSESVISSVLSSDVIKNDTNMKHAHKTSAIENCHHSTICKICQTKLNRWKEKYKRKKKYLAQNTNLDADRLKVKILMRDIGVIEQSVIDEMFEQLTAVYETEADLIRRRDEKRVKRSELELQERTEEMEKSFRMREEELERNVQEKKRFLWGLARALREQHAQMSRAMSTVRQETDNLTAKEEKLKCQISDAEELLKKRGEEMRAQISNELVVLENHLESMKREREKMCKERKQLEELKAVNDKEKFKDLTTEDLTTHYNTLKEELMVIKKHLEITNIERRCSIEKSTLTEPVDLSKANATVLNNEQDADRNPLWSEGASMIGNPDKLVNDLTKQKNVNFRHSTAEDAYGNRQSRNRSRSSSSEAIDAVACDRDLVARDRDLVARLRDENDHLRAFARQQREHIDELSSHRARLQAELSTARLLAEYPVQARPRTAPTIMPGAGEMNRLQVSASVHSVGWPKGAGEEVSRFSAYQPRVLTPEDHVPFVGRVNRPDTTRRLINQWRSLRRRGSPGKYSNSTFAYPRDKSPQDEPAASTPIKADSGRALITAGERPSAYRIRETAKPTSIETQQSTEKCTKSVLREAKEKLKNFVKENAHAPQPDKTPDSVLREAKRRLRKLEIEAEAVEKSYLDFRTRQAGLRSGQGTDSFGQTDINIDSENSKQPAQDDQLTIHGIINVRNDEKPNYAAANKNIDVALSRFNNRNSSLSNGKPIPKSLLKIESELKQSDERREYYLETPLIEFRKLYGSEGAPVRKTIPYNVKPKMLRNNEYFTRAENIKRTENDKESENKVVNISKENEIELDISQNSNSKTSNLNDRDDIIVKSQGNTNIDDRTNSELLSQSKVELAEEIPRNDLTKNVIAENTTTLNQEYPNVSSNPQLLIEIERSIDTKIINIQDDSGEKTTEMVIIANPNTHSSIETKCSALERNSPVSVIIIEKNNDTKAICADDAIKHSSSEIELNISKETIEESKGSTIEEPMISNTDNSSMERELNVSKENFDENEGHSAIVKEPIDPKENNEDNTEKEKGEEDYPDDFSADADYYNSPSEYESHSPISLAKNSVEDDHFWDS